MSAVEQRTRVTTRHEYYITAPACWSDVKLAMRMAAGDREASGLSNDWDDVIRVDSDDESVIVFWEES